MDDDRWSGLVPGARRKRPMGWSSSGHPIVGSATVFEGIVRLRSLGQDLQKLRDDQVSANDQLREVCDRVAEVDGVVHAFVAEPGWQHRVLTTATQPGTWSGIGIGVKDVIHVDGLPTAAGSLLPVAELAGPQASVISRLRGHGATIIGKTISAEFAVAAPGPTTNPHDRERTPGGSSSGSAAAVAAGEVPLALGTQTIGSIIRPAAYCGVVGFRPSVGRVGMDGVIPNSPSLDTLGWFTATVADAALAAEVIDDRWRPVVEPVRPLVLGIPAAAYLDQADADGRAAFAVQVERLRLAGHTIRPSELFAQTEDIGRQLFTINRWELARVHQAWFSRYVDRYRPETAAAIRQGQRIDPDDYRAAASWRQGFRNDYADTTAAAGVDLWIAPAATGVAPQGLSSTGDSVMSFPFSLVGSPVVAIPTGRDPGGLPFGLQCSTLVAQDERLLNLAGQIEAVFRAADARG